MGAAETPARASVKPAPRSASKSAPGIKTAAVSKSTCEVIVHVKIIKTIVVEKQFKLELLEIEISLSTCHFQCRIYCPLEN
jgi:hypothetical protein